MPPVWGVDQLTTSLQGQTAVRLQLWLRLVVCRGGVGWGSVCLMYRLRQWHLLAFSNSWHLPVVLICVDHMWLEAYCRSGVLLRCQLLFAVVLCRAGTGLLSSWRWVDAAAACSHTYLPCSWRASSTPPAASAPTRNLFIRSVGRSALWSSSSNDQTRARHVSGSKQCCFSAAAYLRCSCSSATACAWINQACAWSGQRNPP
jgi:hypothetical protein